MKLERRPGVEFSRHLALDDVPGEPETVSIEASESERAALARRFDLVALPVLSAEITVARRGGRVALTGTIHADVVQRCVVTLSPVPAVLDVPLHELRVSPDTDGLRDEVVLDLDEDLTEPLEDEGIDLGEAVAQQLAVSLDPYPRAPGATFEASRQDAAGAAQDSPFAVLASLKRAH